MPKKMKRFDRKTHWENIYQTKALKDASLFEPTPDTSLSFFDEYKVPLDAKIVDVGGGDSYLVDFLLVKGYQDVTVVDISEIALERAKHRLGVLSRKAKWVVDDLATFRPPEKYDVWHDRAAFHFLTDEKEITNYVHTANQHVNPNGILVIGTFSEKGPQNCSGLPVQQYSETAMNQRFGEFFEKRTCLAMDHITPSDTRQNFVFCSFRKREEHVGVQDGIHEVTHDGIHLPLTQSGTFLRSMGQMAMR